MKHEDKQAPQPTKRRTLRLKAMKYCLTQDGLGCRNLDVVILRFFFNKTGKIYIQKNCVLATERVIT
jgi:hypothetical protein